MLQEILFSQVLTTQMNDLNISKMNANIILVKIEVKLLLVKESTRQWLAQDRTDLKINQMYAKI